MTQKERPLLEASLENAEAIADALSDDGVLKEIPVVGNIFKLCKAVHGVRDRIFAAKLQRFVSGLGDEATFIVKLRKRIQQSPEQAQIIGETLLMVLERITAIEKADLLAIIFYAHTDGVVTSQDFRRIIQAIDMAFIDDLQKLLELNENPEESLESWLRYLAPSGLSQMPGGLIFEEPGDDKYHMVSALGVQFQKAYAHGKSQIVYNN
jgi:hypothetical protein